MNNNIIERIMAFFSFRKLNYFDIVLITYPLTTLVYYLLFELIKEVKTNAFLDVFLFSLGLLLVGTTAQLYYYFSLRKTDEKRKKSSTLASSYTFIKVTNIPKHKINKALTSMVVICLSISSMIFLYLDNIFNRFSTHLGNFGGLFYALFFILFALIFLRKILHINQYRHHYASSILVSLGLIGIYYYEVKMSLILYDIVFALVGSFILCYSKVIMEKKYIQPISLILLYGLSGMIMIGLAFVIIFFTCNHEEPYKYIEDVVFFLPALKQLCNRWKNICLSLLYMILIGVQNIQMFNIIYRNDIMIQFMLLNLTLLLDWILALIKNFEILYFVFSFLSLIILVIGVLVYVEFASLHVFQFGDNTREAIALRSYHESEQLMRTGLLPEEILLE